MNRAFKKSRAEDGFTLIELLIVIVIIGILAAIAVPVFLNQQKAAINATVKSDVRNTTANVILAINKVPTATGFVVYGPGDTLATAKTIGVPNKVVTVPAGQVGVEAVRSRNNVIVINGSVEAGYEVIGCNPDTKFGWKFISNTGLFAVAPDCSTTTGGGGAVAMNTPVTVTTGEGGSGIVYAMHSRPGVDLSHSYFCIAALTIGPAGGPFYFSEGIRVSGQSNPGPFFLGTGPVYGTPASLLANSNNEIHCEPYPGAIAYGYYELYPNTNTNGNGPISLLRLDYGRPQLYGPSVPFDSNRWAPTPITT